MVDVITIGAAAVDVIVTVKEFPKPDEVVLVDSYKVVAGGSTANIAVALAKLGVSVGFVGKIGDDEHGNILYKEFVKYNVDVGALIIEGGARSASTFIAVNSKGDSIIFALGGKAILEDESEIPYRYLGQAKIIYLSEAFPNIGEKIAKYAKEKGETFIYGPGCVFASLFGLGKLKGIIKYADYILLSKAELRILTGIEDIEKAIAALREINNNMNIVVTLGAKGSMLIDPDGNRHFAPAFKIEKVVDATGAGDAFTAGFIYGILKGLSHREKLILGNACGALKVMRFGPRASPTLEEVKRFLKQRGYEEIIRKMT